MNEYLKKTVNARCLPARMGRYAAQVRYGALLQFGLITLCLVRGGHAVDWTAFRGPGHDGVSTETDVPTQWSTEENVRWKFSLPRPGNGSPVVAQGRVFVTSAENDTGTERSLYCVDRASGDLLWAQTVTYDRQMPTHETNPYCGTTPLVMDDRVIVWHASAGLHCYDLQGNPLWVRELGEFEHMWGYGTSPIAYQDRIILNSGPGKLVFVAAFDAKTGKTLWQNDEHVEGDGNRNDAGQYMGSWSTPVVARVDGRDQILVAMPTRLVAYNPENGHILWHCEGIRHDRGDLAYASPLVLDGLCFYTGGFRGPMFAVRLGGSGDVTETHRLWRKERQPQTIGSPVAVNGHVVRPNAGPGTIDFINPQTGEIVWTERASDQSFWGSILRSGDHLYATDQGGTTLVFKADRDGFELVSTNKLEDPSNATPAISDGALFIRTDHFLWCIQ